MDKTTITTPPLHSSARKAVKASVMKFAEQLILQSKIVAASNNASVVLDNHVDEARIAISKRSEIKNTRDLVIIFGSTCLGAFLSGFIEGALSADIKRVVIWAVVGFVGLIFTMFGLLGMK